MEVSPSLCLTFLLSFLLCNEIVLFTNLPDLIIILNELVSYVCKNEDSKLSVNEKF